MAAAGCKTPATALAARWHEVCSGSGNMNDSDVNSEPVALRRELLTQRLAAAGTLAEGLAHEVNNPLNCALLQLAVLQRRLEQPDCQPATLPAVAELVEEALRRLERLFNDLVSLLQPRPAGGVGLAAGDPCRGVVTAIRADSDSAGTRVTLELFLELPPAEARLRLMLASLWPGSAARLRAG
jgi:signal transduction histidine kinase